MGVLAAVGDLVSDCPEVVGIGVTVGRCDPARPEIQLNDVCKTGLGPPLGKAT
jgi:hypothetical protein